MKRGFMGPILSLLPLLLLAVPPLAAGEETPLPWVRVTVAEDVVTDGRRIKGGRSLQGFLQSQDDRRMVLTRPDGRRVALPQSAIARVDVRRRVSQKPLGAIMGAMALGSLAFLAGSSGGSSCQGGVDLFCGSFDAFSDDMQKAGALLGAGAGAVLGALAAPGSRWDRDVPLDDVQLSIGPDTRRGVGLRLTLSF